MRNYAWLLIPFSLSIIVLLVVYKLINVFPFGDRVPTTWDGFNQCYVFLKYLRQAILTGQNLNYSMLAALGMDNIALMTYYVTSPFNIIIFFFSDKHVIDCYLVLILLKVGCSAFTFAWFAHYKLKVKRFTAILFALAYSLMAWLVSIPF